MKKISGRKGMPFAFLATLLLLGMVAVLAACGGSAALVGKWQEVENGNVSDEILEFLKDGTLDYGGITGNWKAEKGKLTFSFWGQDETVSYKVSGSTLTIIDDDGDETQYKKVKK
jgi:hypothetical protein